MYIPTRARERNCEIKKDIETTRFHDNYLLADLPQREYVTCISISISIFPSRHILPFLRDSETLVP